VNEASRYRSFMVRVWSVAGDQGAGRVEIERIQSGARVVVRGLDAERIVAMLDPAVGDMPVRIPAAEDRGRRQTEGSAT
jgi:hypothetical protein